jgi:CelD/BcsL family acetyltransferase involved in cellulose biosynthesis
MAQVPQPASTTTQPLVAPAPPARGEIAVQFLTDSAEFAKLAPDWNRLHAGARAASIFNSWIWQYQWWQVYGREQPLRLLVAVEGARSVGMLALYVHTISVLGVRVRLLRFVGTGADTNPDDLGPVLDAGREDEVALKLAQAVMRISDADVVLLSDIDPRSPFTGALERAAAEYGRARVAGVSERIAYLELPPSWDQYLATLTKHRRTRIRYARRRLAAEQHGRFFVWDDCASLDPAFDRLAELHRLRWKPAGGSESFTTPQYLEFHRSVIRACFARNWLRLYCLEMDGEVTAMFYCYRFRNVVYLMQSGFDPARRRFEPGNVLLGHAIEHAIGEGHVVFDFLRGDHAYKDHLGTGRRQTQFVWAFRNTPGGLAYRLRRVWLRTLSARLRGRTVDLTH